MRRSAPLGIGSATKHDPASEVSSTCRIQVPDCHRLDPWNGLEALALPHQMNKQLRRIMSLRQPAPISQPRPPDTQHSYMMLFASSRPASADSARSNKIFVFCGMLPVIQRNTCQSNEVHITLLGIGLVSLKRMRAKPIAPPLLVAASASAVEYEAPPGGVTVSPAAPESLDLQFYFLGSSPA